MLDELRVVYEAEVERHLATLTAEECALIGSALQKVTGSTCQKAQAEARAQEQAPAITAAA